MSSTKESGAHPHSQSHSHAHHGSSQDPRAIAERLLELKNSDPELFSQAWKKIPPETQDNILAYLRKHSVEGQTPPASHASFEDRDSHTAKHRGSMPDSARGDRREHDTKPSLSQSILAETHKTGQSSRPLYEWTDGELLAHTLVEQDTKEVPPLHEGKEDAHLALELRRISRQNVVQIAQNELIRRLLQTIAGKV